MLWIHYVISLGIHLLFLPLWFLVNQQQYVSLIEMIVGTTVIPIYLIIITFKSLDGISLYKFIGYLFAILLTVITGLFIFYFNWGISTGNLLKVDSESILMMKILIIVSTVTITVGWVIACFIKEKKS